ncbi:hypothetical protein D3C84_652940 [compost metagenome]
MLRRHRPAAVGVGAVGLVDIADAYANLPTGVGLEAVDIEIVAVDVGVLVVVVLAREDVAVLEVTDGHLVEAEAGGALVPVVVVGDVDVVALVETAPGPEGAAVQRRHVAPLGVHLVHPREAVVAGEFGGVAVFVVELRHALDADHRTVVELEQVLAQVQFDVLLALIAQAVFGLRPRQLEAGLRAALAGTASAAAHVASEFQRLRHPRNREKRAGQYPQTFESRAHVHSRFLFLYVVGSLT